METQNLFDKKCLSLWLKDGISSSIPKLETDIDCDVCIVGAGITGIMTAYRLSESGLKVVLIDKETPIHLTSGNTTAKFTFQHHMIYSDILKRYDLNMAKLYYEAQLEGLNHVRSLIDKYNISCDFKETSAILYAENDEQFKEILDEKSAYQQLNIPHEIICDLPLNLKGTGGLKVDAQFELNPVKFLDFVITNISGKNVSVFKNTEAISLEEEDDYIKVVTGEQKIIRSKKVVIATGYPFFDGHGYYFARLEAQRAYLMAFPIKELVEDQYMLISNASKAISIRFSDTDGIKYLLVGGQGHKVGQADSEIQSYKQIIDFADKQFIVDNPAFRWSAQDYKAVDHIPYIGKLTSKHENVFVATGFNEWGMSNGSFASLLISDLIMGTKSKYEDLFNPSRGEVKGNLGDFLKANLNVAKELIKGKLIAEEKDLNDIYNGEGAIIKYHGKRVAAYRDFSGTLFLHDSTCTHLGCELVYNNAEKTFDCPCHGSRFNYDGEVIEGAATNDLKKIVEE